MKKRSMLVVLVLMLILSNLTVFADSAQADAPSAWAKGFIEEAIRQQLVPEELQSRWKHPITREEFCQLALRLLERNNYSFKDWEAITFEDTDSLDVRKVASADVIWGSRVEGTRRWFSPQRSITRQEAAVILYAAARTDERIAIPNGMFVPHVWKDRERSKGADSSYFATWAREAVAFCYNAGVMNGVSEDTFAPNGFYTREQAIVTILKLSQWMDGGGSYNKSGGLMLTIRQSVANDSRHISEYDGYDKEGFRSVDGKTVLNHVSDVYWYHLFYDDGITPPDFRYSSGPRVIDAEYLFISNEEEVLAEKEQTGISKGGLYIIDRRGNRVALNNPRHGEIFIEYKIVGNNPSV